MSNDDDARAELEDWSELIGRIRYDGPRPGGAGDERLADEAASNVFSSWGRPDSSAEMNNLICRALELGYLRALQDVREQRIAGLRPTD
ncbi:hypothetical protein E1292_49080 [Nonomuraea deserti]|uniref:Uncharacterized protein n=1 Tax=Nonomuraea deserti TaxID=1848322 RepID=A0A4R4UAG2_9ACTN|nr:hypothetical protein [Nonomuraea deserti]TDC85023.1 hypothetical protein E1292_49080 [Nonomuraea deserti]